MTRIFRYTLILAFALVCTIGSFANTAENPKRAFETDKIEEMRSDQAYEYIYYVPREPTWWDKFKNWLQQVLMSFLEASGGNVFRLVLYGILIAALVYISLTLAGIKVTSLLSRKEVELPMEFSLIEEDIKNLNFNGEIKDCLDQGEYRKAIRLTYLWSLQKLNEAEKIHWREGKTNLEYKQELKEANISTNFGDLSQIFERAWYGKFAVDREDYLSSKNLLDQIAKEL